MDVGRSINPAVDIGQVRLYIQTYIIFITIADGPVDYFFFAFQIEGAFVQGIGLYTLEEIQFSQDGSLLTFSPATYKIPGFQDIPMEFNVHILPNTANDKAVFSSKVSEGLR